MAFSFDVINFDKKYKKVGGIKAFIKVYQKYVTFKEIGDKFGFSRSYVSLVIKWLIDHKHIEDRKSSKGSYINKLLTSTKQYGSIKEEGEVEMERN